MFRTVSAVVILSLISSGSGFFQYSEVFLNHLKHKGYQEQIKLMHTENRCSSALVTCQLEKSCDSFSSVTFCIVFLPSSDKPFKEREIEERKWVKMESVCVT